MKKSQCDVVWSAYKSEKLEVSVRFRSLAHYFPIVQLVAHQTLILKVPGSSPGRETSNYIIK